MRIATAVLAVAALVLLAILGASAGQIPTFDLLQPAANQALLSSQTAVSRLGRPAARWLNGNQVTAPTWLVHGELLDVDSECWPAMANPGFETGDSWDLPVTLYPAEYSQEQVFAGNRALKTGITDDADNRQSYSSASQLITIPADITAATLSFRLFPQTNEDPDLPVPDGLVALSSMEAGAVGDAQWALILDENGRELDRLVSMRSNAQSWESYEFDLSGYAGQRIRLYFGTFNNGWSGVTALFVDEAHLVLCAPDVPPPSVTPAATLTPEFTATGTPTQTPEATPTQTVTPVETLTPTAVPPLSCHQMVDNGSFEEERAWLLPQSDFPAILSREQVYNGVWALRTGIPANGDNRLSYSSASQMVAIPADATVARLEFALYPQTSEPPNLIVPEGLAVARNSEEAAVGDAQWVLILDRRGNELARPVSMRSNAQSWTPYTFDLLPYKGQTIQIFFGAFNNGEEGVTSLYVDDVSLEMCEGEGPADWPNPTPDAGLASVALPIIYGDTPVGISGRILDEQDRPLEGVLVAISPSQGGNFLVFSGAGGAFSLRLEGAVDSFEIRPSHGDYLFVPPSRTVTIPPSTGQQDFVGSRAAYP